uniref:AtRLP4 n=1 Tax=Arundo donax TaxID=35708 RepID=A0A0A9DUV6_ARUDO
MRTISTSLNAVSPLMSTSNTLCSSAVTPLSISAK